MTHCLRKIVAEDGVTALWRYGVYMSMLRETTYGGAQWGLYTPFKKMFGAEDGVNDGTALGFARKICSGLGAGAVSSVSRQALLVCTYVVPCLDAWRPPPLMRAGFHHTY